MRIINWEEIKSVGIKSEECFSWIEQVLMNREDFVLMPKTRMIFEGSDYCNIMPGMAKCGDYFGLKIINRNENRRKLGGLNLDSQILMYDSRNGNLNAIMDGNYITTMRTAAVAVHSIINFAQNDNVIAMLGLGNIGTLIGQYLFDLSKNKKFVVKLYKYKDHAERFIERFRKYENVEFIVCEDYSSLMSDSDVVVSSVTYTKNDFCRPDIYKKGCTIIPVHMRGFIDCDLEFEHIIVSDIDRAKNEFKNYAYYKKVSLTDDILKHKVVLRETPEDRVLIYNLGLAITDLFFASEILKKLDGVDSLDIHPSNNFYV